MEIFTHLWKVGEKRFFKSLPLAPFFTNFAALLALFTFSSAFAYVIVVVSRLAHPYHPPPESPRKASDPNRAIPPPAPHRRHVEPRRRTAINASFYPSFVYILILRLVVARTLLRRRHLRASSCVGKRRSTPREASAKEREGPPRRTSLNKTKRPITNGRLHPPTPKRKERARTFNPSNPSINHRWFHRIEREFSPDRCDRSIDRDRIGIGGHLVPRASENGME